MLSQARKVLSPPDVSPPDKTELTTSVCADPAYLSLDVMSDYKMVVSESPPVYTPPSLAMQELEVNIFCYFNIVCVS